MSESKVNFPHELRDLPQWVCWRYELRRQRNGKMKPTKVPYQAVDLRADATAPATWLSFAVAVDLLVRGQFDGLGFVVTPHDPYLGVDIDHCIDGAGNVSPNALRWVNALDSYTEYTPSGNGLRVWVKASKPGPRAKSKEQNTEIYDRGRFFTVTGQHFAGTPTEINSRQQPLNDLYAELFPKAQNAPQRPTTAPTQPNNVDDAELLDRMFASSRGPAIRSLWNGDTSAYNNDHSAADLSLCNFLAFWTGRDAERMDRLFRQSGLYRDDKWDARARSGETYGEGTIARAIATCNSVYTPKRPTAPTEAPTAPAVDDLAGSIAKLRAILHSADLTGYVGKEHLNRFGNVRGAENVRKIGDALLDLAELRGSLGFYASLEDIRRLAGVGSKETVRRCLQPLMGWAVAVRGRGPDESCDNVVNIGSHWYNITFCKNETRIAHGGGGINSRLILAKSLFSQEKTADAFNIGGSTEMRNRALVGVIGGAVVGVIAQLESYDQPRRDAIIEHRAMVKDLVDRAAAGECVFPALPVAEPSPVPVPVPLRRLSHLAGYSAAIDNLRSLGVVMAVDGLICLTPDYGPILAGMVQSLGPVALRIISAAVDAGAVTYRELMDLCSLSYGAVTRAMRKLVDREVFTVDRDGMTKTFSLVGDWRGAVDRALPTMRSNGLYLQREVRGATEDYNYFSGLVEKAPDAVKPILQERAQTALDRLLAAKEAQTAADGFTAPATASTAGKRPKAPAMQAPGLVSWERLFELTGKGPLSEREFIELSGLDRSLGAGVPLVDYNPFMDRYYTADDTSAAADLARDLGVTLQFERVELMGAGW